MLAAIAWDQTLVSLVISVVFAFAAFVAARSVLVRQQLVRDLNERRDALQQVLVQVDGPVLEYLQSGDDDEYPQREMVELERCALQAQVHFLRDRNMQSALRDVCYPNRYAHAVEVIRGGIAALDTQIATGGKRRSRDA